MHHVLNEQNDPEKWSENGLFWLLSCRYESIVFSVVQKYFSINTDKPGSHRPGLSGPFAHSVKDFHVQLIPSKIIAVRSNKRALGQAFSAFRGIASLVQLYFGYHSCPEILFKSPPIYYWLS